MALPFLLAFSATTIAQAQDLKIALITGKTGVLESYAKETETGFMMGLEYLTGGKMEINGRKLKVIIKDDQSKPDIARTLLAEAYGDDKVDLAVGTTSSGAALAMLPVAAEYKKILLVEPAVADAITGDKWNRYIFRTSRNSMQDGLAAASTIKGGGSIAFLTQDNAFGRDAVKAAKESLTMVGSKANVAHEEYAAPNTTDFTAAAQRIFEALKNKPEPRVLQIVWAGPNPMSKLAEMKPERFGIALAPGGNILPIMKTWKAYAGTQGTIFYYYDFPKNKMNDWLVAEHNKRYKAPPDMFTAGGFSAASAVYTALSKAKSSDTEKLITAMEGMEFDTPKGKMNFRKEDHQALQVMYHFKIKKEQKNEWDLLELVREIPVTDIPVPVKNKR
ncbi:substrate-binding domain-containing protein [Undibacterium sp. LX40W]|uniref:Substrate-binding domain-containing protein n=2 Tax=Oxalobacteraceae TaxID=75682 RepID=A0A923KT82_9BURK|nr:MULTISPECIES: substrate-binding domain-containing protein [Undibacterium]MBC3881279.1 substrate-binding domain-containing protein [Undibacterium nitidum]MBC3891938.1 substrate-binding domain-containing protein [Undibacterium sp. LX40W]